MHEFTIASSIVETLVELASKQGASTILEVHLKIGKLRALSTEQVAFSYNILAKGTPLAGSRLTIEETTGRVRCPGCGYLKDLDIENDPSFHFGIPTLTCPQCGKALDIEGGDECLITSVRMVLPTNQENGAPTQAKP